MFADLYQFVSMNVPNTLRVYHGAKCDNHPSKPAYKAYKGEEDSMGFETHHVCRECWNKILRRKAEFFMNPPEPEAVHCDGCHQSFPEFTVEVKEDGYKVIKYSLRDYKDPEDRSVQCLCDACIRKNNARWEEEYRQYQEEDEYVEGHDDDSQLPTAEEEEEFYRAEEERWKAEEAVEKEMECHCRKWEEDLHLHLEDSKREEEEAETEKKAYEESLKKHQADDDKA